MYLDVKSSAIKRIDARAVVSLGDDAGQVDDQRVEQHDPDHERRRKQPKQQERKDAEPVDQLPARGLDQEPVQILLRVICKVAFFVTALLKHPAAVREQMLPAADVEHALIDVPLSLKRVRTP